MPDDSVGSAIVEAIRQPDSVDLIAELAEMGLDSILANDAVKDIPIVGLLRKVWSVGGTIRDALFMRNLARLLKRACDATDAERERFAAQVHDDPGFAHRVGEQILLLVDRLDDARKPVVLGHAFSQVVKGHLTFDEFLEVAAAIDRCLLTDLWTVTTTADQQEFPSPVAMRLQSAGVVELVTLPGIRHATSRSRYNLTSLGLTLNRFRLNDPRLVPS